MIRPLILLAVLAMLLSLAAGAIVLIDRLRGVRPNTRSENLGLLLLAGLWVAIAFLEPYLTAAWDGAQ